MDLHLISGRTMRSVSSFDYTFSTRKENLLPRIRAALDPSFRDVQHTCVYDDASGAGRSIERHPPYEAEIHISSRAGLTRKQTHIFLMYASRYAHLKPNLRTSKNRRLHHCSLALMPRLLANHKQTTDNNLPELDIRGNPLATLQRNRPSLAPARHPLLQQRPAPGTPPGPDR